MDFQKGTAPIEGENDWNVCSVHSWSAAKRAWRDRYDSTPTGTEMFCLIMRLLCLLSSQTGEKREIYHFHYTAWPDFGVPESPASFLNFLFKVQESGGLGEDHGPAIVHCSAGIGRSGTFSLVDTCVVLVGLDYRTWCPQICPIILTSQRPSLSSWTKGKTRHQWTSEAFCWTWGSIAWGWFRLLTSCASPTWPSWKGPNISGETSPYR